MADQMGFNSIKQGMIDNGGGPSFNSFSSKNVPRKRQGNPHLAEARGLGVPSNDYAESRGLGYVDEGRRGHFIPSNAR